MGNSTSHTTDTVGINTVLDDLAQLAYETNHDRVRVYPREINTDLTLTAPAAIDTYSAWTALIPANTITMDYVLSGILIENWSAKEYFMIQLARSATPVVTDYIGEMRFNTPVADDYRQTYAIIIKTGKILANNAVWGRIKARTAGAAHVELSFLIQKWLKMAHDLDPTTTWPW